MHTVCVKMIACMCRAAYACICLDFLACMVVAAYTCMLSNGMHAPFFVQQPEEGILLIMDLKEIGHFLHYSCVLRKRSRTYDDLR